MATASVQLNLRITVELNEKIEAAVAVTGEKKSEIIRKALEAYLNK